MNNRRNYQAAFGLDEQQEAPAPNQQRRVSQGRRARAQLRVNLDTNYQYQLRLIVSSTFQINTAGQRFASFSEASDNPYSNFYIVVDYSTTFGNLKTKIMDELRNNLMDTTCSFNTHDLFFVTPQKVSTQSGAQASNPRRNQCIQFEQRCVQVVSEDDDFNSIEMQINHEGHTLVLAMLPRHDERGSSSDQLHKERIVSTAVTSFRNEQCQKMHQSVADPELDPCFNAFRFSGGSLQDRKNAMSTVVMHFLPILQREFVAPEVQPTATDVRQRYVMSIFNVLHICNN
jgi:hypothetical protein